MLGPRICPSVRDAEVSMCFTVCLVYFQSGVCTHRFAHDGRVMCLHAAFDLLFVGLSTGIVTSIDLVVSHVGIRAWENTRVGAWICGSPLTDSVPGPSFFVSNNIPKTA